MTPTEHEAMCARVRDGQGTPIDLARLKCISTASYAADLDGCLAVLRKQLAEYEALATRAWAEARAAKARLQELESNL